MFERYSHFLAYGSTDQETLRELTAEYDGLLVPGTVAAYQADGTRGFVLTLSAAVQRPYAIDPRTPLFQYHNPSPKQSHLALARILGIDGQLSAHGMVPPSAWNASLTEAVAESWIRFNTDYTNISPKQFDKYARRLKRDIPHTDARLPTWILAPYLMDTKTFDASQINDELWRASVAAAAGKESQLRRVIASTTGTRLTESALAANQSELVIWMDDLDEVDPSNALKLADYAQAVHRIGSAGIQPFALYGGYFAVALSTVGLQGASHGVGFSEHRNHVELKTSGGAPARFYVQRLHRYLPIDIASELWRQRPSLVESYYPSYVSRDPGEYSYHQLMKHSVFARSDEIRRVADAMPADVAADLRGAATTYEGDLEGITLSRPVSRRIESSLTHLPMWARAFEQFA